MRKQRSRRLINLAEFTPLYEEQSPDFNPTVEFRGLALKLCAMWPIK